MKVVIDSEVCQGHLRCLEKWPDLFDADDQGHGVAPSRPLHGESEAADARLAVLACPEGAISIEE